MKPSLSALFLSALVAAAVARGVPVALGDELPADPGVIESLTPEQARRLAADFPGADVEITIMGSSKATFFKSLPLNGLTTLDPATAEALAEYGEKGHHLGLCSLTTLDAATAKALANFKGHFLNLGVNALDFDAAEALAEYKGMIGVGEEVIEKLVADHPLSPRTALVYASLFNGVLPFLTAFDSPDSVEIAKALATRKGRLALPKLEKISPKTLTALIAKEDVEIPPIEMLELITEPDGSATDDFVIPEGFEQRQQ